MATLTDSPARRDAKCKEWERFVTLGGEPLTAALAQPGRWQLVYQLRPLELIAYWLGIPFRPYHPIYAVIYNAENPAYYTAPAEKVAELGRPTIVRRIA